MLAEIAVDAERCHGIFRIDCALLCECLLEKTDIVIVGHPSNFLSSIASDETLLHFFITKWTNHILSSLFFAARRLLIITPMMATATSSSGPGKKSGKKIYKITITAVKILGKYFFIRPLLTFYRTYIKHYGAAHFLSIGGK